jgi:hypothetical protein
MEEEPKTPHGKHSGCLKGTERTPELRNGYPQEEGKEKNSEFDQTERKGKRDSTMVILKGGKEEWNQNSTGPF